MISAHLMGGLGNQLFQIFVTIAYGLRNKLDYAFLNSYRVESITPRHSYWDSFLIYLKFNSSFSLSLLFLFTRRRKKKVVECISYYKALT
jgi:hypothetical protein